MFEMASFDPITKQTLSKNCSINNAITSINYRPAESDGLGPSFCVNNIIQPDNPAEHVFWVETCNNCCFWPQLNQSPIEINDSPFLVYFFSDDALKIKNMPQKFGPEKMSTTSRLEIEEICVHQGLKCVYFSLRPKIAE